MAACGGTRFAELSGYCVVGLVVSVRFVFDAFQRCPSASYKLPKAHGHAAAVKTPTRFLPAEAGLQADPPGSVLGLGGIAFVC